MSATTTSTRRLVILGSTGSIGVSALAVLEHLRANRLFEFEVIGLASGSHAAAMRAQALRWGVDHVAIADADQVGELAQIKDVHAGLDSARALIEAIARPGDLVVGAMVGVAGLPATLAAIERGCDIALANKETLVAAGAIVMPLVRERGVKLLPIDSEHSAIFQCLCGSNLETSKRPNVQTSREQVSRSISQQQGDEAEALDVSTFGRLDVSSICRVVITASGGPFRTWSRERMRGATVEEALNHPTWSMGPKVTIDSATLMNKALEMIEAHWLFGLPASKIEVIIHPQSLVHSFVEFVDGSVLAQMSPPDMKMPIQYAITWPQRVPGCARITNWSELRHMDFEPVDEERFIAPKLAREVIERGGNAGAVLNAANEAAVQAFLAGEIAFPRIVELAAEALHTAPPAAVHTMDDVLEADREARAFVAARLGVRNGSLMAAAAHSPGHARG